MLTAQRPTVMTAEEFHAFAQEHQHMTAMWRFVHSGFKVEALRTNTLLFKDDWDWLDARVVAVSGTILAAVADQPVPEIQCHAGRHHHDGPARRCRTRSARLPAGQCACADYHGAV